MVAKNDYKGRLHFKNGNAAKALEAYEDLLMLNSTNLDTYYKIFEVKGVKLPKDSEEILGDVDQATIKTVLLDYAEKLPRVNSHLRLGIRYLQGDDFSEFLARYTRPLLIKGVPSMMRDLKEFYQ